MTPESNVCQPYPKLGIYNPISLFAYLPTPTAPCKGAEGGLSK